MLKRRNYIIVIGIVASHLSIAQFAGDGKVQHFGSAGDCSDCGAKPIAYPSKLTDIPMKKDLMASINSFAYGNGVAAAGTSPNSMAQYAQTAIEQAKRDAANSNPPPANPPKFQLGLYDALFPKQADGSRRDLLNNGTYAEYITALNSRLSTVQMSTVPCDPVAMFIGPYANFQSYRMAESAYLSGAPNPFFGRMF